MVVQWAPILSIKSLGEAEPFQYLNYQDKKNAFAFIENQIPRKGKKLNYFPYWCDKTIFNNPFTPNMQQMIHLRPNKQQIHLVVTSQSTLDFQF